MRMLLRLSAVALALLAADASAATLPQQVGEWRAEAAPLTFQGTELYTFMDGGAELYLEYGFERLESQRYQRGPDEIDVELYRMGDGALGLLTFLRPAASEEVALGDAAFLAGYYLLFAKGPFLGAVTAQSAFSGSREAVQEVAAALAIRLEGGARPPAILGLLPESGRTPSSAKQLRGPVGLRSVSPEFAELLSGFSQGAVAGYGTGCIGGLLQWDDPSLAEQAFKRALDRSPRGRAPGARRVSAPLLSVEGAPFLGAARVGSLVVFASAASRGQVSELIAALRVGAAGSGATPESEAGHE